MAQISIDLSGGDIGGELDVGQDMREVSLKGATIGVFHAEGKKLTVEFLEGARFGELSADHTTEFYNEAGQRLPSGSVSINQDNDGYFFQRHSM
ncbi:MAG: hypothetical protein KDI61_04950 [Alphaproteobacteria bacterium]|nr:hypothetical protein [Alphaproteobacteria bacterium]MCB1839595.1 hypothetical protein [Alphaproteobacteria bacterium]